MRFQGCLNLFLYVQDDGSRKMSWEAEDMKHHLGADMFKEFGITMKV